MILHTDVCLCLFLAVCSFSDWKTGKIEKLQILGDTSTIKGKNILIVDDIYLLGLTLQEITNSLRILRCFVEDHFPVIPSILVPHSELLDYFMPPLWTGR